MSATVTSRLSAGREWILAGEFCSLLHDLGKLSAQFLRYRQTWHASPTGFSLGDPHECRFITGMMSLTPPSEVGLLTQIRCFPSVDPGPGFSPDQVMETHVRLPAGASVYERALKHGDSLDSALDRNNPLFSAEQTDRKGGSRWPVFRSNVFGWEAPETEVTGAALETSRDKLFAAFATGQLVTKCWLATPGFQAREKLFDVLRRHFEPACSDTTRPGNDTSLWEHTYAVASLTKALQAYCLIYGAPQNFKWRSPYYRLWAIGWDALGFISRGQKLHDLGARRELLKALRNRCREVVEVDLALGNAVYEDDNSLVFLVPAVEKANGDEDEYGKLLKQLKRDLRHACLDISSGEVLPHFAESGNTSDTTETANVLAQLSPKNLRRFKALDADDHDAIAAAIAKTSEKVAADNCSICGLRPANAPDVEDRICELCQQRRVAYGGAQRNTDRADSLLLDEIADGNGRMALLVGRFGLDRWLNGAMIRSLFVTEAQGLTREVAELGLAKEFAIDEGRIQRELAALYPGTPYYNFDRIKVECEAIRDVVQNSPISAAETKRANLTCFLYDRRITSAGQVNQNAKSCASVATPDPWFPNRINAKSPTPSSLLDVWMTTGEFFQSFARPAGNPVAWLAEVTGERQRVGRPVESQHDLIPYAVYAAVAEGGDTVEFYVDVPKDGSPCMAWFPMLKGLPPRALDQISLDGSRVHGATIRLSDESKSVSYRPFREILATPQIFLALVPGDAALTATELVVEQYRQRFGKVWGRLPLSVGAILFDRHMPMFIVLDSARRMLANFADQETTCETWKLASATADTGACGQLEFTNGLRWEIPTALGDGQTDYYHPYQVVPGAQPLDGTSFFPTPVGNVLHVSDVKADQEMQVAECRFKLKYLDNSAARFEGAGGEISLRLEAATQKLVRLWRVLTDSGVSDAALRGLGARLGDLARRWNVEFPLTTTPQGSSAEWLALADIDIRRTLPTVRDAELDLVLASVRDGLLLDTLKVFYQGLKRSLSDERSSSSVATRGPEAISTVPSLAVGP